MNKSREALYQKFHESGYPSDPEQKAEFARNLFGAMLVGAADSAIEDVVNGIDSKSEYLNNFPSLKALSETQKNELKKLIFKSSSDLLYWVLVKIEDINSRLSINIEELSESDEVTKICTVNEEHLKYLFFDWAEEYSDYLNTET